MRLILTPKPEIGWLILAGTRLLMHPRAQYIAGPGLSVNLIINRDYLATVKVPKGSLPTMFILGSANPC